VAQYFLHTSQNVHPGYVPASLIQRVVVSPLSLPHKQAPSAASTTGHDNGLVANKVLMPVCRECGGPWQPGIENTTVRLVRSSHPLSPLSTKSSRTTARRRASRLRARTERRKSATMASTSMQLSSSNSSKKQQERSNLWHYIQEPELSKTIRHYSCKNLLVITCGWCGHESTRPGIPWPKPNRRKAAPNHPPSRSRAAAAAKLPQQSTARHNLPLATKASPPPPPPCSMTTSTNRLTIPIAAAETVPGMVATDAVSPLDDFVALPSPPPSVDHRHHRPPHRGTSSSNKRPPPSSSYTAGSGGSGGILQPKRKKAKGGKNNKSALLNFLSSLND
jgi:hypothetical protein